MSGRETHLPLVKAKAQRNQLDWRLLDAMVSVESSYIPELMKYEEGFTSRVIPSQFAQINRIDVATESQLEKFSYGLGQIMGGTARGYGYSHPLTRLLDPEINLDWVCRHLLELHKKYTFMNDIISVYNCGSLKKDPNGRYIKNQKYVDEVISRFAK